MTIAIEEKNRARYIVSLDIDDLNAALRILEELFKIVQTTFPDQRPSVEFEDNGREYYLE